MNLDQIFAETNPGKFINDLADFVTNPDIGGMTPLDLKAAPPLVKGMIFLRSFYLTTFSSGIGLWFEQDYDDYPALEEFFDQIGAGKAAAYIRAAKAIFTKGRVPADADSRWDFIDEHCKEFYEIDRKFKADNASEESLLKLRDYLRAHQEAFDVEVKAFWKIRESNKPKWAKKKEKYL